MGALVEFLIRTVGRPSVLPALEEAGLANNGPSQGSTADTDVAVEETSTISWNWRFVEAWKCSLAGQGSIRRVGVGGMAAWVSALMVLAITAAEACI